MALHYPEELLPAPSHITGPTWRRYPDGSFFLPEKTLGWAILNWMAEYLVTPGGRNAGAVFLPTLEQARFILWWYAVDETGRFVFRSGVLRRLKGWGKDPLAAALALVEAFGPVAFSHFDAYGTPVGKKRHAAWITIAAVSQEQTKNTFRLFRTMTSRQLREEFGLDLNKFVIYGAAGEVIEAATSSPDSIEGNRPTFVIKNETQWWDDSNDGHEMAEAIAGNIDKAEWGGCRSLSICNAHRPGDDSDAERDYDTYMDVLAGKAIDTGILYDALEAPASTPLSEIPSPVEDPEGFERGLEKLREGLLVARGDAVWLDVEGIMLAMLDRKRSVTESRRKFLNQVNAHEDSWIATYEWDACYPDGGVKPLAKRDRITLGFDGSKSNDHTALVACRVEDGALFLLKSWDPEKYPNGEVPRERVDDLVHFVFSRYDVVGFRADVKEFEAYVDQWGTKYKRQLKVNATPGNPVAFDMRGQTKRFALDCERFLDAVLEKSLCHDNDPILRQHVLNARRHPTTYDAISIRKASKDSTRKIDAAVCAVLAFGARQDYLMSKRSRGRGVAVFQ